MAEENKLSNEQIEFMKKLKAIGSDLWGGGAGDIWQPKEAPEEAPQEKPAGNPAPQKKKGGIDSIWKTADETVDWTDALAHNTPTDGLTGQKLWKFYHANAEKVLAGDLDTYAEVLRTANPLGELTHYAQGITMRAPSADRLESTFICREELLREKGEQYLSAMGLRIARDLLACLPACEAAVTGEHEDGRIAFQATYTREQLRHRNFAFLDPVELAKECGAQFEI